jgi:hypothetical protein
MMIMMGFQCKVYLNCVYIVGLIQVFMIIFRTIFDNWFS